MDLFCEFADKFLFKIDLLLFFFMFPFYKGSQKQVDPKKRGHDLGFFVHLIQN